MKRALLLFFTGFVLSTVSYAAPIAQFTQKSVIFLVKLEGISIDKQNRIQEEIFPVFKSFSQIYFQENNSYFMMKDISFVLRVLSLFAQREISDYDILVRIDLTSELTAQQLMALKELKKYFGTISSRQMAFLSSNYQFHNSGQALDTTQGLMFINRWMPQLTAQQAQDHWFRKHGPLVVKVGLPPVVPSYTQIHTDMNAGHPDLFEPRIQGLSFETITSQSEFISYFVRHSEVRKLNETLIADEVNFTPPPLFFPYTLLK